MNDSDMEVRHEPAASVRATPAPTNTVSLYCSRLKSRGTDGAWLSATENGRVYSIAGMNQPKIHQFQGLAAFSSESDDQTRQRATPLSNEVESVKS
jgi:hypothetical protein